MNHILLIDGNNIGYASMYIPALSKLAHDGKPTGAIMGVAQSVMRICGRFPGAVPVVLWDGRAEWRKALCPEYKENRHATAEKSAVSDAWHYQQPMTSTLLHYMGVIQVRAFDAEADDLAGRFSLYPEHFDDFGVKQVTLVSGDTDWWQAISEKVDWFTPITDKSMTLTELQTEGGKDGPFSGPDEYLLAKCVAGDTSDNIPGVPGVGIATALKLLRLHGGLEGISKAVQEGRAKDKKSAAIAERISLIERNRQIMDWMASPKPVYDSVGIIRQTFDPDACQGFCKNLALTRLAIRLEEGRTWANMVEAMNMGSVVNFLEGMVYGANEKEVWS